MQIFHILFLIKNVREYEKYINIYHSEKFNGILIESNISYPKIKIDLDDDLSLEKNNKYALCCNTIGKFSMKNH